MVNLIQAEWANPQWAFARTQGTSLQEKFVSRDPP
jgi:hypothetical protein